LRPAGAAFYHALPLQRRPRRWQSGWNLFPKATTIHDWSENLSRAVRLGARRSLHGQLRDALHITTLTPAQKLKSGTFISAGSINTGWRPTGDHSQALKSAEGIDALGTTWIFSAAKLEHSGHEYLLRTNFPTV